MLQDQRYRDKCNAVIVGDRKLMSSIAVAAKSKEIVGTRGCGGR